MTYAKCPKCGDLVPSRMGLVRKVCHRCEARADEAYRQQEQRHASADRLQRIIAERAP